MSPLMECQIKEHGYRSIEAEYRWFWDDFLERWMLINLNRYRLSKAGKGKAFPCIAAFRLKTLKVCPQCGVDWEEDIGMDQFGCWSCGFKK